jgi:hypothetical protein
MQTLRHIWEDIRHGENIDLYITVLFAILLAILVIIGVESPKWLTSLNLTLLALLAVSILGIRQQLEKINVALTQTSNGFLQKEWSKQEVDKELKEAENILLIGVSLSRTIRTNLSLIDLRLQQGAKIKVLLVDPSSAAAQIAANRLPVSVNSDRICNDIRNSLLSLESIARIRKGLEIRVLNNPMSFGGIFLDTTTSKGIIYIEQYSFKMPYEDIPKFVLRPDDDFWYNFFADQVLILWENAINYTAENKVP